MASSCNPLRRLDSSLLRTCPLAPRPRLKGQQPGPLRACPLRDPGWKDRSQLMDWTQVHSAHAHSGGGGAQPEGSQSAGDWTQVCSAHAHSGAPARRVGGCWQSSGPRQGYRRAGPTAQGLCRPHDIPVVKVITWQSPKLKE